MPGVLSYARGADPEGLVLFGGRLAGSGWAYFSGASLTVVVVPSALTE